MTVITGATGHLGTATIDFLISKGVNPATIAAFVRDPQKANDLKAKGVLIRVGSYEDHASMVAAFRNADKLLFISSSEVVNRSQQQAHVVKAAQEAGVKHIVYTSFVRKNDTGTSPIEMVARSHRDTEDAIKASGIPYTFLLNSLYADILDMFPK